MDDRRNLVTVMILSLLIVFGWPYVVHLIYPAPKATVAAQSAPAGQDAAAASAGQGGLGPTLSLPAALASGGRVRVETPKLAGSIALTGARIDDMVLTRHRVTAARNSGPVRLLAPAGTADGYFVRFGWTGTGVKVPDATSVWQASAPVLSPGHPVTLSWDNGAGQTYQLALSVDPDYLLTVDQRVQNHGTAPVAVTPYAVDSRTGESPDKSSWQIHVGPMGVFNGTADYGWNWKDLVKAGPDGARFATTGGWIGFTDKYWLTALIPPQNQPSAMRMRSDGHVYQVEMATAQPIVVAPGQQSAVQQRLFVGAKEVSVLDRYTDQLGIQKLDLAIDWGWYRIIEKPFLKLLDWLYAHIGNFGLSIIALTLIIRGVMFPIAQRGFASMASMRAVAPKQKAIQERHKDDKARAQQEIMKLYKEEKINPLGGCLPLLLQIPIFFALYKVLSLSIEMRHQHFLWLNDLSAPDPLTPVNLFGLLPFHPPAMLAIGVLPILVGITMYVMQRLNPPAPDPTQQQMMMLMPWMMMFFFAPLAAGLQLYYVCSNLFTVAQQQYLYSRHPGLKAQAQADAEAKRAELAKQRAKA